MYKCPFCKSENCVEITHNYNGEHEILHTFIHKDSEINRPYDYNLSEMLCNDCGMVSKVDSKIYEMSHK